MNTQRALLSFSGIGTVALLGWILALTRYGIDFTDEGFYLVSIANPFAYTATLTQFGYIYHPIYNILTGDIASLRQFNILLTFFLSWSLAAHLLKWLASEAAKNRVQLHIVAAGFSTSSLILFDSWLVTPSYNSLALQAVLITSIGFVLARKTGSISSIIG